MPDAPWYIWGKSLNHPGRSRWIHHWCEWLVKGDAEEKVAAEFYGLALRQDFVIVMIEGRPVGVTSHYTKALQTAREQDESKGFEFQDITYPREENPLEVLGLFLEAPGIDEAYLGASAASSSSDTWYHK